MRCCNVCARLRVCSWASFATATAGASAVLSLRKALLSRRPGRQAAVRQVVLGELQQERVELLAFLVAQRGEEVVLDTGRQLAQLVQHLAARRRHLDDLATPVGLVALPAD